MFRNKEFHGLRKVALCKKSFSYSQMSLQMADKEPLPSIPLFSERALHSDCEDTQQKPETSRAEGTRGAPDSLNRVRRAHETREGN